jgi:ribonuclease P protein component
MQTQSQSVVTLPTSCNESRLPNLAVSVDHARMRKAREARGRRERALRAMMAKQEEECEGNPFVSVVKNQRHPDQVKTAAGQVHLHNSPATQQDAPIPALGSSRLNTDFTFRPRPQTEHPQHVEHSESPTTQPPDAAVEHVEAARPKAAPARSGVDRIHRQGNSQKQLQEILGRAEGVEAARVQVRRQREFDHLVRASTSHARTNHVKDSCHE